MERVGLFLCTGCDIGQAVNTEGFEELAEENGAKLYESHPCLCSPEGVTAIRKAVEDGAVELQHLICAQHGARHAARDGERLHFGERVGLIARRQAFGAQALLHRLLVDGRAHDLERETGLLQEVRADGASGGKDEPAHGWFRRSARRLSTAAAVSSMERRDTSITGQPCFS